MIDMTALKRFYQKYYPCIFRIIFTGAPFLLLLSGFQFEFTAVRAINHGRFIYSLDDPYIHLALAERISLGHYGINLSQPSAPSSSILWPLFLAPFAKTAFFEYVPLALNFLAALATLHIYTKIIRSALTGLPDLYAQAGAAWISIFLIPATNLIGLAYTGMEHSLQVFLCSVIVLGLIHIIQNKPAPGWLAAALIIAPGVRYECLAVCLPALLVLFLCRHWRFATASLAGMLLPLFIYSLFLHSNHLGWLPTSVIAKISFAGYKPTHNFIFDHLQYNLQLRQGQVLGWIMLVLIWLGIGRRRMPWIERLMALLGAGAVLVHLAVGQIGWWDRYEIYMVVTGVLLVIYLGRSFFQRLFWSRWNQSGWFRYIWPSLNLALLGGIAWMTGQPYFGNFARTALASANIYEQQYQMHRLVVDYLHAPVAVNDLGWVAFRNPDYVLDLWGLASTEALQNRTTLTNPDWMDRMAHQHQVRLIMIYDTWFKDHPHNWVRVARLHLAGELIVAGSDTVTFYVSDSASAGSMETLLNAFKPTLPPGVRMEIGP